MCSAENAGNRFWRRMVLEVRPSLRRIPASHHALHVGDRYEGVGVLCLDVVHKLTIFLFGENSQNLLLLRITVAAGGGVDGDTSLERLDDVTFKIIIVLGDDTDADLSGELVNEVVQNETAEVSGQGSDDHGLEIVGKVGACDGHKTSDDDGFSEVHMEIFVHDLRDNVETAGRSVRVKEDSLSVADHDDHGDHIHSDISGRGYRTREQKLEHEEQRRKQEGDKDDLCPKGLIYKEER